MTGFRWRRETLECEIVDPHRPTYVPLSGNRCWALLPTDLDGYCYCVDLPNWMRVLRRFGLYLQLGAARGALPAVLTDLRTFYGPNCLRLTGSADQVAVEIRVFPDVEATILYVVVAAHNRSPAARDAGVLIAADLELHPAHWACKGFTGDATADYSGLQRRAVTPHDDHIRVAAQGTVFYVWDRRHPGAGFLASAGGSGWTLDRAGFSFETPFGGYRPGRPDLASDRLDLAREEASDDSLCVIRHDVPLTPDEVRTVTAAIGYQMQEDPDAIGAALERVEEACARTRAFYAIPLVGGVKLETPDEVVNAQFNLFNLFVKMNEHHCEGRRGFLPAAHYYNWLCGDFFFAAMGYAYTHDRQPLLESLDLFRSAQHEDGFIPNLPLWTEGASWRDRHLAPLFDTLAYVIAECHLARFTRDRQRALAILPALERAVALAFRSARDGLIVPGGDLVFDAIDWPPGFGHCPQTFVSCMTYKAAMDLAALCDWLEQAETPARLRTRAEELRATINDRLWLEDRGHYCIGLPVGRTGRGERDAELFSREMVSWSSIVAVLWGIADRERGARAVDAVRDRLFTPYGLRFFEPYWQPAYTDASNAATYAAGRVQNGAWWQTWWSIESLARAEMLVGRTSEALAHLDEVRLDRVYSRFTMAEKGRQMRFLRSGEWTDTDMTFPVTSIPYMLTAACWNQTLLEMVLGLEVGYDEIAFRPHLPASWPGAQIAGLQVGDSTWMVEVKRVADPGRLLLDGVEMPGFAVPITPGRHAVRVELPMET